MQRRFIAVVTCLLLGLAGCAGDAPPQKREAGHYKLGRAYEINGRWYHPNFDPDYDETGVASWYGQDFQGLPTANGEVFDKNIISAAHTTLPLPSFVEVTNLDNGRVLKIRVNDRGPFVDDRLIDLSEAAAEELGFRHQGLANVRVRFLGLDSAKGTPPVPNKTRTSGSTPASTTPRALVREVNEKPPATCGFDEHFVQVTALSSSARINQISRSLEMPDLVRIDPIENGSGSLYRLRVGPLTNRMRAFDVLAAVHGLGYREAYVVSCS